MVALTTRFCAADAAGAAVSVEAIVDAFERAEAQVVLDDRLDPQRYQELVAALRPLQVVAVELPCPRGRASEARLCAEEKDEAQVALQAALDTIARAGEMGARFVVVRLGEARRLANEWTFARTRFLRGELDERTVRQLSEARWRAGERPLDGAARALDRLCRAAEGAGATLCVRNARRFIELPSASEMDRLVAELRGAPLAPLLDVAGAHLLDVMGFEPLALTQASFGVGPLAYLGDACGPVGALAPGRGELDVGAIARALPESVQAAFSPWAGLRLEEVVHAVPALARAVAR
jgi:sugar phosphate isomerase/epimerase